MGRFFCCIWGLERDLMRVGGEGFLLYMGFRKRLNEGGWGGFFVVYGV